METQNKAKGFYQQQYEHIKFQEHYISTRKNEIQGKCKVDQLIR